MFSKRSKNRRKQGVHFQSIWRYKSSLLGASHGSAFVGLTCAVNRFGQKSSGYVTGIRGSGYYMQCAKAYWKTLISLKIKKKYLLKLLIEPVQHWVWF